MALGREVSVDRVAAELVGPGLGLGQPGVKQLVPVLVQLRDYMDMVMQVVLVLVVQELEVVVAEQAAPVAQAQAHQHLSQLAGQVLQYL